MDTLLNRLGAADVRLTAQRRVIAECLDGPDQHLTADEILVAARKRIPEVGRATVYKALAEFVSAGSVREVQFGDEPKRFDPNAHVDHHHLICNTCGGIWDVVSAAVTPELSNLAGFRPEHVEVSFFGQCATCRSATKDSALT